MFLMFNDINSCQGMGKNRNPCALLIGMSIGIPWYHKKQIQIGLPIAALFFIMKN